MKILVAVKRVVDANARVRVRPDETGVEISNAKMAMNPFDEIALEAAIRLREGKHASEVIAASIGPQPTAETLRLALAMGADRGIHIKTATADIEPLAVAKLLRAIAVEERPGIVILGKQAIDDDCGQTGQMLAALMRCGQATFASRIDLDGDRLTVVREVDGGLQTVELALPAVVTTDLRLNTPRYVSLPEIMRAKKKPLAETTPEELGVDIGPRLAVVRVAEPGARAAGIIVGSVPELLDRLRNEANVL